MFLVITIPVQHCNTYNTNNSFLLKCETYQLITQTFIFRSLSIESVEYGIYLCDLIKFYSTLELRFGEILQLLI